MGLVSLQNQKQGQLLNKAPSPHTLTEHLTTGTSQAHSRARRAAATVRAGGFGTAFSAAHWGRLRRVV